jgi:hypothetical protein
VIAIPGMLPKLSSPFIATTCPWCHRPTTAQHLRAHHAQRWRRFRCGHGDCARVLRLDYNADDCPGEPVAVKGRR